MNEIGETVAIIQIAVELLLEIEVMILAIETAIATTVAGKSFATLLEMATTRAAIVRGDTGECDEGIDTVLFIPLNLPFDTSK